MTRRQFEKRPFVPAAFREAPPLTFRDLWGEVRSGAEAAGIDLGRTPAAFFCQQRACTPLEKVADGRIVVPEDLLLDTAAAEAHFDELVERGCGVVEITGVGLCRGVYLVALDHAFPVGSPYSSLVTAFAQPQPRADGVFSPAAESHRWVVV